MIATSEPLHDDPAGPLLSGRVEPLRVGPARVGPEDQGPPRPALYTLADFDALGSPGAVVQAVATMAEAGVDWIQVRAKRVPGAILLPVLEDCLRRLEGSCAKLWVDDRVDLAALCPVAGVHLGQDDLPPREARKLLGERPWIGFSTHDLDQIDAADHDPAVDVIALGPIFETRSKQRPDPVVGLDTLRRARGRTRKPLVAIGGIDAERIRPVLDTGVDAAVVLGAVCRGDVAANCKRLLALAREVR